MKWFKTVLGVLVAPIIPLLGLVYFSCTAENLETCFKFFGISTYFCAIIFLPLTLPFALAKKTLAASMVIGALNATLPLVLVASLSLFKTVSLTFDQFEYFSFLAILGACGGAMFWWLAVRNSNSDKDLHPSHNT